MSSLWLVLEWMSLVGGAFVSSLDAGLVSSGSGLVIMMLGL